MRRKRVETYFALYLTAIIAFLVVASERDKVEEELKTKNEKILAAFLRSAPVEPERDTLYWNVDADDRTGIIRGEAQLFKTFIRVRDIRSEDSVSMSLSSLHYDGEEVVDKSIIQIKNYFQEPSSSSPVVLIPVECHFKRTGIYDLAVNIHTIRIHETANGELQYNEFVFSRDLIDKSKRDEVEKAASQFTVIVQDTSALIPLAVEQIAIDAARQKIVSASGFEETNEIFVNLPGTNPVLRIVYGSGTIERQSSPDGKLKYFWKGNIRSISDSVVIEARIARGAGGKDIARTKFFIMPNEPFLVTTPPNAVYAGEEFTMSLQVEGLNNASLYSWVVSINGEKKSSGNSPMLRYVVPNGTENAELIMNGFYDGKTYRCLLKGSNRSRESNFVFKIQKQPAHIFFSPPSEVHALHTFTFDAVRFGRGKRSNEKPINFNEISIRSVTDRGDEIPTDYWMTQPGSFEFKFRDPNRFIKTSQEVTITIRAAEATEQEIVRVTKK